MKQTAGCLFPPVVLLGLGGRDGVQGTKGAPPYAAWARRGLSCPFRVDLAAPEAGSPLRPLWVGWGPCSGKPASGCRLTWLQAALTPPPGVAFPQRPGRTVV